MRGQSTTWEPIKKPAMTREQARALVAEAKIELDSRGSSLPATGSCHECGRKISGNRKFCGPCAAKR